MTRSKTDLDCNNLFINRFIIPIKLPLFHYAPISAAKSIKTTKELWMTNYRSFSDKKEFLHGMELIIEHLKEESKKATDIKDYYAEFLNFLIKENPKPLMAMYVMCFCKRKTNKFLAKNYRKKEPLSLVEFDFHSSDVGPNPVCIKIIYSKKRFLRHVRKLFHHYVYYDAFHRENSDFEKDTFVASMIKDIFILSLSYKHHKYAAEEEIRLIKFNLKDVGKTIIQAIPSTKIILLKS